MTRSSKQETIRSASCGVCDYDLRGLRRDQACPECGTTISEAIRTQKPDRFRRVYFFTGRIVAIAFVVFLVLTLIAPKTSSPNNDRMFHVFYAGVFTLLAAWLLIWGIPLRARRGRFSGPIGHVAKAILCGILGVISALMALLQFHAALTS